MVLGVVVGLAAGLALGLVAGLASTWRAAAARRPRRGWPEGRLADALAQASEQSARAEGGVRCRRWRLRRRVRSLATELSLLRSSAGRARRPRRGRAVPTGRRRSPACRARRWRRTTSSSSRWPTRGSTRPRTAAQGELAQRQQAIAQLLDPLSETLARYERGVQQMEVERQGAYEGLTEKVTPAPPGTRAAAEGDAQPGDRAAVAPDPGPLGRNDRSARAVEMAGMLEHCDFDEQVSTTTGDGTLPSRHGRAPARRRKGRGRREGPARCLPAASSRRTTTHERGRPSSRGTPRQLRTHVDQLAKKEYWKQFERSPHFVVAFIPGDQLLAAAFEADPALQEHAMANGVAADHADHAHRPLRTSRSRWQQETLAENAREVAATGGRALRPPAHHDAAICRRCSGASASTVEAYNRAVGSFESRVLVSARKFPASASSAPSRSTSPNCPRSTPHLATSRPTSPSSRGRDGADRSLPCRRAAPTPATSRLARGRRHAGSRARQRPAGLPGNSRDVLCRGAARPPLRAGRRAGGDARASWSPIRSTIRWSPKSSRCRPGASSAG